MLSIETTSQFRKDYRRVKKRGCDMHRLAEVLEMLVQEKPLDARFRDHALTGNMNRYRECHIQPDWLLIYRVEKERLVLVAQRTGTHADLFDE